MSAPLSPSHEQHVRQITTISFVLGLATMVGLSLYLSSHQAVVEKNTHQSNPGQPVVPTPQFFTDFVGTITKTGADALTAELTIVQSDGTHQQHVFQVVVDQRTTYNLYLDTANNPVLKPATLAEFHDGDLAHIFSDHNLYNEQTFTATKVYKIITS